MEWELLVPGLKDVCFLKLWVLTFYVYSTPPRMKKENRQVVLTEVTKCYLHPIKANMKT